MMDKKKTKIKILILIAFLFSMSQVIGQEDAPEKSAPISFGTTYIGDAFNNFNGGIKTGSGYMGYIDLTASISTKGLGWWNDGELFINVQNTHGTTGTEKYFGDAQVVSNIDNGDYTYLYQFWYKQQIGKLSILAGIHDLNAEFFASDYSGEYVNSSLGIMPAVSVNAPVPIFPKTTLGAMIRYDFSESFAFQAAIYDGDPLDLDSVPYNGEIHIGDNHGTFSVAEMHYMHTSTSGKNGTYKLGFFYHSGDFDDLVDAETYSGNYGFYLFVDQMLLPKSKEGDKGLAAFFQLGLSPDNRSLNDLFIGIGLNYYGNNDNILGLGFAHASLSNKLADANPDAFEKSETAIEFFYKMKLGEYITIQPEIQYIINPGFDKTLDNTTVGLLRTYFEF